jgi:F-type H+-transporting ATPase subunit b
MESIIGTFHIDLKIIIAQMVNFAVVFVVLYIFALKPLSKLMAERSEKIAKGITDAKESEQILKDTNIKYEEALNKARIEANKIFEDAKKEGEAKKTMMLEDAKNQVSTMIDGGKKMLEAEKVKMVEEAKKEIVNLAMLATEKLTGAQKGSFDAKAIEDLKKL